MAQAGSILVRRVRCILLGKMRLLISDLELCTLIFYLYISACSANCASCNTAGADKCDAGQCDADYGLDTASTCLPCADHCSGCQSAGAGKCESNECDARYIYVAASQTCQGEREVLS